MTIPAVFGEERKVVFNPNKSKVMVNWRKPLKRMVLEMVIGAGHRRKVRVKEIDEYCNLGVIIRVRGRIFIMQEQNQDKATLSVSESILQGE